MSDNYTAISTNYSASDSSSDYSRMPSEWSQPEIRKYLLGDHCVTVAVDSSGRLLKVISIETDLHKDQGKRSANMFHDVEQFYSD